MLKHIDARLVEWATATKDHRGSLWGDNVLAKPVRVGGNGEGRLPLSPSVLATERAVLALDEEAYRVVMVKYHGLGNSEECWRAARMSKRRYYLVLDDAHIQIDRMVCGENFFSRGVANAGIDR